ncbi:MAG: hypothetical protein Q8R53_04295 [Nanoarchaeota archaeon]|nr:hypothetical protein [Nanoarchaeota archaeon]
MYQTIKLGSIKTSRTELIDIAKAWLAVSVAFTIAGVGVAVSGRFLLSLLISMMTVGLGFLLHELAHKFTAQRYGCTAEFRAFDQMLLFAIALSFLGFVFAAPGAVMIAGQVTRKENGIISAAGPLTNYALALVFLALEFLVPAGRIIWSSGLSINIWLGLFNMLPFWNFDGKKIWSWNPLIWGAMVACGVLFMVVF